jgi:penicillin-binding protein 2
VSIGQGATTVTPLQLARSIGGIATGGIWQTPHLVKDFRSTSTTKRANLTVENVIKVIDGMYAVVNEGGTGVRARIPTLEVCGKTGTAQLASNDVLKGTAVGRTMKDNAWFVGFAPRSNPEIVVVALFESGEHGNLAAPIVRDVIKAHFDKKQRNVPRTLLASHPVSPVPEPEPDAVVGAVPVREIAH